MNLDIMGFRISEPLKQMCLQYGHHACSSCFFRMNRRVRISAPCNIPIAQYFAKNTDYDIRRFKQMCTISEFLHPAIFQLQYFSSNSNLDIGELRISDPFETSVSARSIRLSFLFSEKKKGQNF
jgi:hypothetical protein